MVKPEFSKTARIELAPDNGLSEAVDVGKFPASRLQLKGDLQYIVRSLPTSKYMHSVCVTVGIRMMFQRIWF